MSAIDYKKVSKEMLSAMQAALSGHFDDAKELAEDELEDFAKRSAVLTQKVADGKINRKQAEAILRIRRNAVETVLLSISGIGVIAAQDALNAAISVLKNAINSAIPGVSLL